VALETIRYEVADGVGTVTLHRPHKLNALNTVMLEELLAVLDQADADDAVRALIVTGAGRAFCAGADLSGGGKTFDRVARRQGEGPGDHEDGGGRVTLRIYDMKKPLIAAINGPAVGFGITMTLPMDVRLASTAARIGFVFARRGVVPEACSTWFLPRLVGPSQAAEWVYTQNTSAISVALSRQMMWRLLGADHPMEAHRLDSRCMDWTGRSADAHEGVTAFLEKRPPRFTLRPSADMPPFYPWWRPRTFASPGSAPGEAPGAEP
jgi:enoyl-CoA hydratase/carnithine racemase